MRTTGSRPRQRRQAQLAAREGQARSRTVAERLVVASKPGNAGGAKGPQFKDQRE